MPVCTSRTPMGSTCKFLRKRGGGRLFSHFFPLPDVAHRCKEAAYALSASSAVLWFPRTGVCGPCLTPTRAHVALGGEGAVVRRGRDRIGRLRPRWRRAAGLLVEDRAGGELEEAGRGSRRREGATGDSKRSDILRGEVEDENGPHSGAGRFLLLTAGRDADQPGWQRDELSMIKQDHVTKQRSRARSVKSRSAALRPTHGLRRSLLN
jgi:hypothetical protein